LTKQEEPNLTKRLG